jgi:hypothetical protein
LRFPLPTPSPPRLRATGANLAGQRLAAAAAVVSLLAPAPAGASNAAGASGPTPFNERCIKPAAGYHYVDARVLRAILKVESGLNPAAYNTNANKTVDVGIGQINSIHFPELRKQGVYPQHLQDACVGTYVAAWQLARVMAKNGNTWEGIARYHSASPYCNFRYQVLVQNELVRSGAMRGRTAPVPAARPCGGTRQTSSAASR